MRRNAILSELLANALGEIRADDHDEANAAIEHAVHLGLRHVPQTLHPSEHRRHRPIAMQEGSPPGRQDARQVIYQTAAGYVCKTANDASLDWVMAQDVFNWP